MMVPGTMHHTYTNGDYKSPETLGKTYCTAKKGTGVNQDARATNAAEVVNCREKIKVKDWSKP